VRLRVWGLGFHDMDGGGRCQLNRVGTDRDCSCPFCTDGRLESKFGECSRCASSGSNREPSTSRSQQHDVKANSAPVEANSPLDRSLRGQVSNRNSEVGQFYFPSPWQLIAITISGLGLDDFQLIACYQPELRRKFYCCPGSGGTVTQ